MTAQSMSKIKEEQLSKQGTRPAIDIVKMGHPVLHSIAEEIDPKDFNSPEIHKLIDDLKFAVAPTHGSGIAAPQIGVNKRLVIFGYDKLANYPEEEPVPFTVLINPKYTPIEPDEQIEIWEHCISLPKLRGKTHRYYKIKYSGYSPDGDFIEREASGIHAILVQHEIDHLDGRLFCNNIINNKYFGFIDEFEKANIPLEMKRIKKQV